MFSRRTLEGKRLLMFGDNEVMQFDLDRSTCEVIDRTYLPYGLRMSDEYIKSELSIDFSEYDPMFHHTLHWLAERALPTGRVNSKLIYNTLGIPMSVQLKDKYKIVDLCCGVSVLDKYWVKPIDSSLMWDDVNPLKHELNNIIMRLALWGERNDITGSLITPELTAGGSYPKAWRRHEDGTLWLYKRDMFRSGCQSKIEVYISDILDKCNVNHVHYEAVDENDEYLCICSCMTNDDYSIVTAHEYKDYCYNNDLDFEEEVLRIDADSYYKMWIVDYLVSNGDRHSNNWGFYMNNKTMELVSLHPLFDHNNAFDKSLILNSKAMYRCTRRRMQDDAMTAIGNVDFHFTDNIVPRDFIVDGHYKSFMSRAEELGIETVKVPNN